MTQTISTYEQQAIDFLEKFGVTLTIEFLKNGKHFEDDETTRDIYKCELKRGNRSYTFNFGQSVANSMKYEDKLNKRQFTSDGSSAGSHKYKYLNPERFPKNKAEERFSDFKIVPGNKPTSYDILSCLTKYDPGTFEDFCGEFGYDTDSRKAYKTYEAVKNEWQNIAMLFTESELEELREIQ